MHNNLTLYVIVCESFMGGSSEVYVDAWAMVHTGFLWKYPCLRLDNFPSSVPAAH